MSDAAAFDIEVPIWSESAVLALSDGTNDVHVRLCRYPSAGVAWIWANVDLEGSAVRFGYSFDRHRSSPDITDVDGGSVLYGSSDVPCSLWRDGPRRGPLTAGLSAELDFHTDPHPPNRPGSDRIRIDARFVSGSMSGSPNSGRSEVRGEVEVRVWLPGGERLDLRGHGHWHEQHQEAPRFRAPFTYIDLRGDDLVFVAIKSPRSVRGTAQRGGEQLGIAAVDIAEPAADRALRVEFSDGSSVSGVARAWRERSVNIHGRRRPSTDVVVEGAGLVGTINDWDPGSPAPTA